MRTATVMRRWCTGIRTIPTCITSTCIVKAEKRQTFSWLLDGRLPIDKVERTLEVRGMLEHEDFVTLAGFVLHQCGHVPQVGEHFVWRGWRFEVLDLDGRRIDKVLASRVRPVADVTRRRARL